ncbi:hypothetical protein AB0M95_13730 [Sphaerisporangium sp. NPDC051017]|uniref:hypothetical protein n=1 Tax=Sphaerisporangium sp. NPDC051017 TaxID=3154636 RepID=UPI00343AE941
MKPSSENGTRPSEPVNESVRRALLGAIEKYLEEDPSQLESKYLANEHPELMPRTFCSVQMVELRTDRSTYIAGVYSQCHELARKGNAMVAGTALSSSAQIARMEIHNGTPRLVSLESPEPGAGYLPTLRKMFTEEGVRKITEGRIGVPLKAIYAEARKAFGLPADAKIIDDL